jgi:outer membrane protein
MRAVGKKLVATVVVVAALAAPAAWAQEPEGPWLVRGRMLYMDTANKSDSIPALGVPSDAIHVQSKWFPEVDITYFFTKNLAAELILTYPQKLDVTVESSAVGKFKAGTFKALPPTLTLQWHFLPDGQFRPYVGAGINVTWLMDVDLSVPALGLPLGLDSTSVGAALQAGIDIKLAPKWFVNVDVKYIWMQSDVTAQGLGKVSEVKVDPWLFGIGVGYRF